MKSFASTSTKIIAAVALVASASTAFATQATIFLEVGPQYGEANPYQYGDGGEFTALTNNLLPGNAVPAGYAADATLKVNGITGFETFCVEDMVDFYVGTSYDVSEGYAIQQQDSIGYLTSGVAWLYQQFATGQLAGYNYADSSLLDATDGSRLTDAGELQATLWYLENEPADANVNFPLTGSVTPGNDPFLNLVLSHFGGSLGNAQVAAGSQYGVKVLELTDETTGASAQDQLIYVPDTATTALLLGASLLALFGLKRRFKAA